MRNPWREGDKGEMQEGRKRRETDRGRDKDLERNDFIEIHRLALAGVMGT